MPGYELINSLEKKALTDIFKQGSIFFAHGFDRKDRNIMWENSKICVKNILMWNIA